MQNLDPRIGIAMRGGVQHFYVHVDGKFPVRPTVAEVMDIIEGRAPSDGPEAGMVYPASSPAKATKVRKFQPDRQFAAHLTDPSGYRETYRVEARNKTEARREIRRIFREDTPPPSAGFYRFEQCRLEWIETDD